MSPADKRLLGKLAKPTDDVDLELLLMLARFEASVHWNEIPLFPHESPCAAARIFPAV